MRQFREEGSHDMGNRISDDDAESNHATESTRVWSDRLKKPTIRLVLRTKPTERSGLSC